MKISPKLKTALLEFARLLVFALPGVLIEIFTQDPALAGAYGVPIMAFLKAWDRAVHEDQTTSAKGILPF